MSVLSGQTIQKMSLVRPMFVRSHHAPSGMSYGLSAAGYDVRVEFDNKGRQPCVVLAPGGFVLASTVEEFTMPNNVIGFVHDKSSWARRGIALQNTVIEPGWSGYLTLEISNHGESLIRIWRGSPIAQVVFHFLDEPALVPYFGKYSDQERGPQEAR
jgi:dCTP deaminase